MSEIDRFLGPTASARRWFATEVRRFREKRGWSQAELASRVFLSEQQIGHFETGYRTPAKKEDCVALDRAFGLDGHFEGVFTLLKSYEEPQDFWRFLKAEQESSEIRAFEPQVITGLMQVEPYIRHLCQAAYGKRSVDDRVATRLGRQKILQQPDSPWLWLVMDYPALYRNVGGPEVMRQQYERLLALGQDPKVKIQVIPQEAGVHAGLGGSLHLLKVEDGTDVAWSDSLSTGRFIDQPDSIAALTITYDLIRTSALSAEATLNLIESLLEKL